MATKRKFNCVTLDSNLVYGSGACSVIEGVDSIMRLKEEEGVDVVIGGLCSSVCVPAGYNLRYWNIPYFPASCSNPDMADKNKFPTLARVMPSYNKLGGAFLSVVQYYNWKRVVMVNEDDDFICDYGARGIKDKLEMTNIIIAEWIRIPNIVNNDQIIGYLERVRTRGRIILMCHTRVSVMQRIMEVAYDLGMTTREYLYISYTLIPSSFNIVPWSNTQYGITTKVTEEQMAKRKEAFKVFRSGALSMQHCGSLKRIPDKCSLLNIQRTADKVVFKRSN
ncbi:hypothetical protein CAPTEDRAFT_201024 [Capitella teleta]|uniref:Receptor ligand binding region domain-containing protein n=1 Tax=Capitella teleta TaxID=283909 RepID=R7UBR3_CAPTE|nr:hypothetical protein CAPTEDRAFT_201024 [Capitella teleta]|eukprot:ELU03536.1 hypothetical protein CAPTEDRAFT_201024 [Capitella teleta]